MSRHPRTPRRLPGRAGAIAAVVVAVAMTAGCVPEPETDAATSTPTQAATPTAAPQPAQVLPDGIEPPRPLPTGPVESTTALPRDCRAILDDAARTALASVPLEAAILSDGTLRCSWGEPGAATVRMTTTISHTPHYPTLDYLNELIDKGFVCFSPDDGVRCELSWENPVYGVEDGRTLYFRDEVLIDSQYSHLAPSGYTAAIVRSLWPPNATPTPSPSPTG